MLTFLQYQCVWYGFDMFARARGFLWDIVFCMFTNVRGANARTAYKEPPAIRVTVATS